MKCSPCLLALLAVLGCSWPDIPLTCADAPADAGPLDADAPLPEAGPDATAELAVDAGATVPWVVGHKT